MKDRWWEIPGVVLLMLVLALISTYPLIQYFDTAIPYSAFGGAKVWNRSGDQIQLMYWFWLVKENFLGNIPFDSNPFEFNMVQPYDTSGLNSIPLAFIYMLFSPFGDVAAYNCTLFSSYILTGLFMYLLVREYTGSKTGALLAAIIFTFAPSRIRGLTAGHGYGFLYFCYPFIIYYLERGIRSAKIRYGIISSVGLVGLAMLEPHLIYYFCVFLGIYIPTRILSLFAVSQENSLSPGSTVKRLPVRLSFLLLWGSGTVATIYAQTLFSSRDHLPFLSVNFGLVVFLYPLLLICVALFFAAVYQRLSNLDFPQSIALVAKAFLPLYLLIPFALLAIFKQPVHTGTLVLISLVVVILMKIWLLRLHLVTMLKVLASGLWMKKRMIFPILPLILSMGGIVFWMSSSKVEQVASTIAGGGRTLRDVGIFSAQLSDLLSSISNVYIGLIPAAFGGGVLVMLLAAAIFGNKHYLFVHELSFLRLFYCIIAFCSLILSLGVAFGQVSLYVLFFHYFPFFNYPRVSDRIITLALFALAIIAGFVVHRMQSRCKEKISKVSCIMIILAAIGYQLKDYNVFLPMGINILDRGQDIYRYVEKNIGDKVLLEIPIWPGDSHQSSLYQHYIMLDRVPRINGCSPMVLTEYIENVYKPLASINQGRFDRQQFELLHQLGVKYITVHDNRDVFPQKVSPFAPITTVRRLQNSQFLEPINLYNAMYFKTWKGQNVHLFLFQLKERNQVDHLDEQAWYEMPYFYDTSWRLHNQVGHIVKDTNLGKPVFEAVEGRDKDGFLVFGPNDIYSAGNYRCYFSIKIQGGKNAAIARLEVVSVEENGDISILAHRELEKAASKSEFEKENLDFSISKDTKLQFRVFYTGKGMVRVEKIVVNNIGNDKSLEFIKAEKMVGDTGIVAFSEDAITGKVVEATIGKSKQGDIVFGPNRLYKKGSYVCRFLLRIQNGKMPKKKEVAAQIIITDGQNLEVFAQRPIYTDELEENIFTKSVINFELRRDEFISFHLYYTEKANIEIDGIEILAK